MTAEAKATEAEARAESLRKERNSLVTQVSRTPVNSIHNRCRLLSAKFSGVCSRRPTWQKTSRLGNERMKCFGRGCGSMSARNRPSRASDARLISSLSQTVSQSVGSQVTSPLQERSQCTVARLDGHAQNTGNSVTPCQLLTPHPNA